MTMIVDLTPKEIYEIIQERNRLKAALQEATAAFLYLSMQTKKDWNTLPEDNYSVPESIPGVCDGGILSGQSTYRHMAQEDHWVAYWLAIRREEMT